MAVLSSLLPGFVFLRASSLAILQALFPTTSSWVCLKEDGWAAAIAYTFIETVELNGVDPQAWLAGTLAHLPDYKVTRVEQLLLGR